MGTSGRGPKIKIQDVEERSESDAGSSAEAEMDYSYLMARHLRDVADGSVRARNLRLPESVTQGESEEDRGIKVWVARAMTIASMVVGALVFVLIANVMGWL